MDYQEPVDYNKTIEVLLSTFGEVLSREVLYSIVESYDGDVEQSANAVMNIIVDGNHSAIVDVQPDLKESALGQAIVNCNPHSSDSACSSTQGTNASNAVTNIQYASLAKMQPIYQGAKVSPVVPSTSQNLWTDQLKLILAHHEKGARILIIMRGVPGSGKSFLAKKIIDAIYYSSHQQYYIHILSTDDFFVRNGLYTFDKTRLSEAHEWNKSRAKKAMTEGLSPIIIDNTNIELWEMEYYVSEGVKNGYIIDVVEPNTPWAKKVNQLFKKNSHNVPYMSIKRMLDNFQSGITGNYLVKKFGLQYSHYNKPPVLRTFPPFSSKSIEESLLLEDGKESAIENSKDKYRENTQIQHEISNSSSKEINALAPVNTDEIIAASKSSISQTEIKTNVLEGNNDNCQSYGVNKYSEMQKCLEEMEKVEIEWDNGEHWDDQAEKQTQDGESCSSSDSKPQRKQKLLRSGTTEQLLPSVEMSQDWSKCATFLPSWEANVTRTSPETSVPVVEKRSSSTCLEYGDTDISNLKNPLKIITAVPRNINEYHVVATKQRMPEKWMLDKSTSTNNNDILSDTLRCQNEEQHFKAFRKLFNKIARSDLRDIFDNCCGDVNWAVDIVFDGMANSELHIADEKDLSDSETEEQSDNTDLCHCLSAYDIIPDHHVPTIPPPLEEIEKSDENTPSCSLNKKGKKENQLSETSLQIKRQIEQNVVIPDTHYSDHCLKIRKIKRGEHSNSESDKSGDEQNNTDKSEVTMDYAPNSTEYTQPSCSYNTAPNTSQSVTYSAYPCDEDIAVGSDDVEKTVNITLGKEFVKQLDEHFGRDDMEYPAGVLPKINIPMSILNEINALWIESFMHQLEEGDKQSEILVKQDEEFARQLAKKEEELAQAGKEPEVPDFKEIMDMDFALSLYHKDVAQWRNNEPNDLAAKLSRDKLYNLFPDVSPEILSELLMAHDNNFQLTVEVLLMSTGKSDVLSEKNGVSKFVMEKEMERKEKILEEEKQAATEVDEWPLLSKSKNITMTDVQQYRDDAVRHLNCRNVTYQKAQEYIRRGMTQVASYFSDVAVFHKNKYEWNNSMAAAALIYIHTRKWSDAAVMDFHYLRVGEARETLDLFIDSHIQRLREMQVRQGVRLMTLFFVTGRGLHSNGRPRLKPAVKRRLLERGLTYSERNPGLLATRICANDKLSYQIA